MMILQWKLSGHREVGKAILTFQTAKEMSVGGWMEMILMRLGL